MIFRKRKKESMHIELTPLIDAIFILLIFYMLSSNFLKPIIQIRLPVIEYREKKEVESNINVTVDKNKKIFVNGSLVTFQELEKNIATIIINNDKETNIIFSGDKSIEYDLFLQITSIFKSLGIQNIALENEQI
jgi:biopolymer transport protein ExbD